MNEPIQERITSRDVQLFEAYELALELYNKVIRGCEHTTIVHSLAELLDVLDGEDDLP